VGVESSIVSHVRRRLGRDPSPQTADADLVRTFIEANDETAFAALVDRYGPMVLGVARRVTGDHHSAEDVVQATFLAFSRRAKHLRRPGALPGWLHRTAVRLGMKAKKVRAKTRAAETTQPGSTNSDVLDGLTGRELLAILDEELAHLPDSERVPLILCCLDGLAVEEAAERLGTTFGTIKGRLERGRLRLRSRFVRRGLTFATGAGVVLSLARPTVAVSLRSRLLATVEGSSSSAAVMALTRMAARSGMSLGRLVSAASITLGALIAAGVIAGLPEVAKPIPVYTTAPPPKNEGPVDAPLPEGAILRLGSTALRHPDGLTHLRFSADGKTLESFGHGRIRKWETETGRRVNTTNPLQDVLTGHFSTMLSSDGTKVIVPHGDYDPPRPPRFSLREYDLQTGRHRELFEFPIRPNPGGKTIELSFHTMTLSPDGTFIAEGRPTEVRFWDLATGKIRQQIKLNGEHNNRIAFSADGKQLLTSRNDEHSVTFWDVATGKEVRTLSRVAPRLGAGVKVGVMKFALSPDGRWLAAIENVRTLGEGPKMTLWDVSGRTETRVVSIPTILSSFGALTFSPDGKFLYTASELLPVMSVAKWDVEAGKIVADWAGLPSGQGQLTLAVNPDGTALAIGTFQGVIQLFDTRTGKELVPSTGHAAAVAGVSFSKSPARVRTVGADLSIAEWDQTNVRQRTRLRLTPGEDRIDSDRLVNGLLVTHSSDGRWVAGLLPNTKERPRTVALAVRDAATGEKRRTFESPRSPTVLEFTPDGRYLVGQDEGLGFQVWDPNSGETFSSIARPHRNWSARFTLLPDSKTLFVCDEVTANAWDLALGKKLFEWKPADLDVFGMPVPADTARPAIVRAIAASPDGKVLALSNYGPGERDPAKRQHNVVLVETETGKVIRRMRTPETTPDRLVFSPDGKWIAGPYCVWDAQTLAEVRRFPNNTSITAVAFSSDSQYLATGHADGTTLIWPASR
jgi:RNA polymerase sigma factor (sigma-70 family)